MPPATEGRSKEVINRGGELISPVEVEDAVATHDRVAACAWAHWATGAVCACPALWARSEPEIRSRCTKAFWQRRCIPCMPSHCPSWLVAGIAVSVPHEVLQEVVGVVVVTPPGALGSQMVKLQKFPTADDLACGIFHSY